MQMSAGWWLLPVEVGAAVWAGLSVGTDKPSQGAAWMGQGTAGLSSGSHLSVASATLCHIFPSCDHAGSRGC